MWDELSSKRAELSQECRVGSFRTSLMWSDVSWGQANFAANCFDSLLPLMIYAHGHTKQILTLLPVRRCGSLQSIPVVLEKSKRYTSPKPDANKVQCFI